MYFDDIAIMQNVIPLHHLSVEYGARTPYLCKPEPGYEVLVDLFGEIFKCALFGEHEGRLEVGLLARRLGIDPYHTGHFKDFL